MVESIATLSGASSSSFQAKPAQQSSMAIEEPMDLVLLSLKEKVYVKCRHGRELRGKLVVIIFKFRHSVYF